MIAESSRCVQYCLASNPSHAIETRSSWEEQNTWVFESQLFDGSNDISCILSSSSNEQIRISEKDFENEGSIFKMDDSHFENDRLCPTERQSKNALESWTEGLVMESAEWFKIMFRSNGLTEGSDELTEESIP